MDLKKLFNLQRELDAHIEKEHPRQKGENRLTKKILAFQVELSECCNEWKGFKFWKVNPTPNTETYKSTTVEKADIYMCDQCHKRFNEYHYFCPECHWNKVLPFKKHNPLLEEYVDGLHFVLSIGLELQVEDYQFRIFKYLNLNNQFMELYYQAYRVLHTFEQGKLNEARNEWMFLMQLFLGLGDMFGFTWTEIEKAYLEKNEVNHQRQESGY